MRSVAIIGSTGSIGRQTLEVVEQFPQKLKVEGLAAQSNWRLLAEQAIRYHPSVIALGDESRLQDLRLVLAGSGWKGEVLAGRRGIEELAARPGYDVLVSAAVGAAGIRPTLAAIQAGRDVALANKECLVAAGAIIMPEAQRRGVKILPVDSEHSAVFQCLEGRKVADVQRILLTASGGPFRLFSAEAMRQITPDQALAHPTWNMGDKVTVDSATLMNKGLEVIEAHWLFNVDFSAIQVVVHPQSAVHSLIELKDGSIIAQLGPADMRLPIQLALVYPERLPNAFQRLNLFELGRLDFEQPDLERFPCLALAYEAGKTGGTMPAVMNAANEMAVQAFLERQIGFVDIPRMVEKVMGQHQKDGWERDPSLDDLFQADQWARSLCNRWFRGI